MSRIRPAYRRGATAPLLLALSLTASAAVGSDPPAATTVTREQLQLLAATDPFATAPAELRIEMLLSSGAAGTRVPVELWRRGDTRALVRFLQAKDRGKYVIRRDHAFWFLAPNARNPVKLAPALAPAGGAALDELLAVRPSRDYQVDTATEDRGQVTFDLTARPGSGATSRVRWVVDRARRLPLRAEFRGADGRVTRMIEFKRWRDPAQLVPAVIVVKDVARGGLPLEVEFVAIEARAVSEALFDLADPAARAALPPPAAGSTVSAKP